MIKRKRTPKPKSVWTQYSFIMILLMPLLVYGVWSKWWGNDESWPQMHIAWKVFVVAWTALSALILSTKNPVFLFIFGAETGLIQITDR